MRKTIHALSAMAIGFVLLLGGSARLYADDSTQPEVTVDSLIDQLDDTDAPQRARAIQALAARGVDARPALPKLRTALQDDDPRIRALAAIALGELAAEPDATLSALEPLLSDATGVNTSPVGVAAGLAMGGFGEAALPYLTKAIGSDDQNILLAGLAGLSRVGPPAKGTVPRLIEILKEDDPKTRNHVHNTLIAIGPGAAPAVPVLIEMLGHEDFHTQYWSCRALASIGPESRAATEPLLELLKTGAASVRHNAATALGNIGPDIGEAGVAALIAAFRDRSQPVRQKAVIALGKLGDLAQPAAPAIVAAFEDPERFVPHADAALTLWKLDPKSPAVLKALLTDLALNYEPWEASRVLGEIGVKIEAVQPVSKLLTAQDLWTRQYAAESLGKMGPAAREALPALEPLLVDDVEQVRDAARAAIDRIQIELSR